MDRKIIVSTPIILYICIVHVYLWHGSISLGVQLSHFFFHQAGFIHGYLFTDTAFTWAYEVHLSSILLQIKRVNQPGGMIRPITRIHVTSCTVVRLIFVYVWQYISIIINSLVSSKWGWLAAADRCYWDQLIFHHPTLA